MKKPDFPENEVQRQKAVERYKILDSIEEESFDNLTSIIADICEVPIALVSILDNDRNFLKSHHGVPFNEDLRERSFCAHTILEENGVLIIPDATKDERFYDNPLVTEMGVRFYAGASLVDAQNIRIGAFCVFGTEPKILSENQRQALYKLSKQVILLMENRLLSIDLINTKTVLNDRNQELEKFALTTSHDLKSPLNNISGLLELLKMSAMQKLTEEERDYIELSKKSANFLSGYISGLLHFYKCEQLPTDELPNIESEILLTEIVSVFSTSESQLTFQSTVPFLNLNKELINQILINLISNGLKYNNSKTPKVNISLTEDEVNYCFEVKDNGIGISVKNQDRIFNLFETFNSTDRSGNKGTGIGLATVKKLVTKLNGTINVSSTEGEGSVFTCIIPKSR